MHAPAMPPCAVMAETAVDFISVYDAWSKREPAPNRFEFFTPYGARHSCAKAVGSLSGAFLVVPVASGSG